MTRFLPAVLLLAACAGGEFSSDSADAWWAEEAEEARAVDASASAAYLAEVCEGRFDNDGDGLVDEGCTGTCDTFVSREKGDWTLLPCVLAGSTGLDFFADGAITAGGTVSLGTATEVRDFLTVDIATSTIPLVTGAQQFVVVSKLNMIAFGTGDLLVADCTGDGVDDTYATCVATLESRVASYGSIPNSLIKDLALLLRDISKLGVALPAPYDETCRTTGVEDCNGLDDDGDGVVDNDCACLGLSTGGTYDGVYTGTFEVNVSAFFGLIKDSCVGTMEIDILEAGSPQVVGIGECSFSTLGGPFAGDVTGSLSGSDVTGEVTLKGIDAIPFDASITGSGPYTISGTYSGELTVTGITFDYDGSFTASQ